MNRREVLIILNLFFVFFHHVEAQSPLPMGPPDDAVRGDVVSHFQPSLAVVIGILSIMFSFTFILLLYAKFCHRGGSVVQANPLNAPGLARSASGLSGIDKTVIESLPFFRFSSLKGSREGLECAVCLSKFEEIEILRLLPKCKHAFHIDCVDQWLEKHSSCPLCRCKVSAEDITIFTYSDSMRFLRNNQSEQLQQEEEEEEDSNIELFVQREEDHHGSSRFSVGSSFRRNEKGAGTNEKQVLIQDHQEPDDDDDDEKVLLHKFNHKIVVSDHVVFKNRWSNVSSSDLMFLNSEMLSDMSSKRFSEFLSTSSRKDEQILKIKEDMERKVLFETKISKTNPILPITSESDHSKANSSQASSRSMSDITALSRFGDRRVKNRIRESSSWLDSNNVKEERMRRLWLPIARKTVQWFANREKRPQQSKNSTQSIMSDV